MKQHVQIALSATILGILYLAYTKYIEFVRRQERLETNLKNVIDAVNQHYLSQYSEESSNEDGDENEESSNEDKEDENQSVHVSRSIVFDDDDEDEGEDDIRPSDDMEHHNDFNLSSSESEDEPPIQITRIRHCPFVLSMGKNKGSVCGKRGVDSGYCKLHLKHIPKPME